MVEVKQESPKINTPARPANVEIPNSVRNREEMGSKSGQEEQKAVAMDQTINQRAFSGDLLNAEERNWYELRPCGQQPERRGYHCSFVHNNM